MELCLNLSSDFFVIILSFCSLQPIGGVKQGEIFRIPIPTKSINSTETTKPKDYIKVCAPTDLVEGCLFRVKVKGVTITAPIPKGGVKKGEIFKVPFPK